MPPDVSSRSAAHSFRTTARPTLASRKLRSATQSLTRSTFACPIGARANWKSFHPRSSHPTAHLARLTWCRVLRRNLRTLASSPLAGPQRAVRGSPPSYPPAPSEKTPPSPPHGSFCLSPTLAPHSSPTPRI